MGINQATFYAWRKKLSGLGVVELRRLRQLEGRVPQAQAGDGGSEP
ncbi:hypothetical protein [Xanthomonas cannabis]